MWGLIKTERTAAAFAAATRCRLVHGTLTATTAKAVAALSLVLFVKVEEF